MESQPLFVIGAPRSGTTFLCHILNQHPFIQLTNESRIFVLLKDLVEVRSKRPDLIGRDFRELFVHFVCRHAGDMVERFYRESLGTNTPIWGDKHPPHGDPSVLSGRTGSQPRLPQSGSCLRLIRTLVPRAKFIHIHRDPLQVAHSLVKKSWTPSIDDGVQVWRQYVSEIVEFLVEMDGDRHLTLAYHDLVAAPEATSALIGRFLGLTDWSSIETSLLAQRRDPTPFSDPATNLVDTYRGPRGRSLNRQELALAGKPAEWLGYARL